MITTRGTGSAYPSGEPEFAPDYCWGSCCSVIGFQYFVDHCLSFCLFSYGYCFACSSL